MFPKSVINANRICLVSAVLVLAAPQAGLSQEAFSPLISDDAIAALDEIVVYGEPPLRLLRDEVYAAEENFYALFNALNDGRQFDIECFYRTPVGSLITRRVCEANFARNSFYAYTYGGNGPPKSAFVRYKQKQMLLEMEALVSEHEELQAALMAFADAKMTFDSAMRDRCANRDSLCRE